MDFEEKYFSLTDQISLPDYLYFLRCWTICAFIVICCCPVCDVINFEISLSFLIKPLSYMTKKSVQDKNVNILRTKRAFNMKYKAFSIIFERPLVIKNCLRPDSGLLKTVKKPSTKMLPKYANSV